MASRQLANPDFPFRCVDRPGYNQPKMKSKEVAVLFQFREALRSTIDAPRLSRLLQQKGYSHTNLEKACICEYSSCEILISCLPFLMSLIDLIELLHEMGYKDLGAKIHLALLKGSHGESVHVHKSTSGQRPVVHTFFRNLKRKVHDAMFKDPRQFLRELADRHVDKMMRESNQIKKQLMADKCIAIIGAEIDAIAITFDNNLCEHYAFDQMRDLVGDSSNSAIADVVYFGRLANANSIIGNFDEGENMLLAARCQAYNTGPCLELVNMLYIEVYVKLWQFEHQPTESLRQKLLMWGRVGLQSLEEEDPDTKTLWRRMFVLRMVFCLLGLGNRANVIENCPIDDGCLVEAEILLADIDRFWNGIEARRKMFYFVAKARLCYLKWIRHGHLLDLSDCIVHLRTARKLALHGNFKEQDFIMRFLKQAVREIRLINTEERPRPVTSLFGESNGVLVMSGIHSDWSINTRMCGSDEAGNFVLLQPNTPHWDLPERGDDRHFRLGNVCPNTDQTYQLVASNQDLLLLKVPDVVQELEAELVLSSNNGSGFVILRTGPDGTIRSLHDNVVACRGESPDTHFVRLKLHEFEHLGSQNSSIVMTSHDHPLEFYVVIRSEFTSQNLDDSRSRNFVNLHSGPSTISLPYEQGRNSIVDNYREAGAFLGVVLSSSAHGVRGELNTSEMDNLRARVVNLHVGDSESEEWVQVPELGQEVTGHAQWGGEQSISGQSSLETSAKRIGQQQNENVAVKTVDTGTTGSETVSLMEPELMNLKNTDCACLPVLTSNDDFQENSERPCILVIDPDIVENNNQNDSPLVIHTPNDDIHQTNSELQNDSNQGDVELETPPQTAIVPEGDITGACDNQENLQLHIDVGNTHFLSQDRLRTMSTSDYHLIPPTEQDTPHDSDTCD